MEKRVKIYQFSVLSKLVLMTGAKEGEEACFSDTNQQLYATEKLALMAAQRTITSSSVSILIIEKLATLPRDQIKKLRHGLPWDENLDIKRIDLETVSETEHPI